MKKNNNFYKLLGVILIFIVIFKILLVIIPSHYAYLVNIIFWFLVAIGLFIVGGLSKR